MDLEELVTNFFSTSIGETDPSIQIQDLSKTFGLEILPNSFIVYQDDFPNLGDLSLSQTDCHWFSLYIAQYGFESALNLIELNIRHPDMQKSLFERLYLCELLSLDSLHDVTENRPPEYGELVFMYKDNGLGTYFVTHSAYVLNTENDDPVLISKFGRTGPVGKHRLSNKIVSNYYCGSENPIYRVLTNESVVKLLNYQLPI